MAIGCYLLSDWYLAWVRSSVLIAFAYCLGTIFVFIFCSLLMATTTTTKTFSFVKFYFTIVSIISVIGMVIAYAIASYQLLMLAVITNEEWVTQRAYYDLQQCEQPSPYPMDVYGNTKPIPTNDPNYVLPPRTKDEIATCKQETMTRYDKQRSFETKQTTIGGLVRGTFLLILFITHYPRMMKLERQAKTTETMGKASMKKIAKK